MSIFPEQTEQEKKQEELDEQLRQRYQESMVPAEQLPAIKKQLSYSKWAPILGSTIIGGVAGGIAGYLGANPLEKCQGAHIGAIKGGGIGQLAAASLALAGYISGKRNPAPRSKIKSDLVGLSPNEYRARPFTTTKLRTQLNQDYEAWQKEQEERADEV